MTDNAKIEAAGKADIVERLRIWPATGGKDAFSGHFVEAMMLEAATEIASLRETLDRVTRVDNSLAAQLRKSIENNAALTIEAARVKELEREQDGWDLAALEICKKADARATTAERERDAAREALKPFVAIRDQFPESAKLIHKKLDEFTPIKVTVTKAQFRAARAITGEK